MTDGTTDPTDPNAIFRVIYSSTMALSGSAAEISDAISKVIEWSRDWNGAVGITGALLVDSNSFAQVLEGPAAAVKPLLGNIVVDPRHRNVTILEKGFVTQREFGEWSMAYVGSHATSDIRVASDRIDFWDRSGSHRASAILDLLLYALTEAQPERPSDLRAA